MADYIDCACGRGRYNADTYTSCYDCYQERAEGMLSCVFCGRWHSEEFATCYRCRVQLHRDEAGQEIRTYIGWRDGYRCRNCGDIGTINIDHIQPCKSGGGAALWNLQVLCTGCNRVKGSAWFPGGPWSQIRRGLFAYYYTTGRHWLDATQRQYARTDYDASEPISDPDVWDRWLVHNAALVLQSFEIDPEPEVFYCTQCRQPASTFYGTDDPVCRPCWDTNHLTTTEGRDALVPS